MTKEEGEQSPEKMALVVITIAKGCDGYNIHYNPFVPDEILINALESALKGLKEGKVKTKLKIKDVEIGVKGKGQ